MQSLIPTSKEEVSEDFLVVCGVVMGSLASLLNCFGLNLQKMSLCDPANEKVSPFKQRYWVMGLGLVIVGSIIDFLAFGLAPQSLLAPLAALALVWNLGVANQLLGESYTVTDILAAITIIIGTGFCVSNAPHREIEYDLTGLLLLWSHERVFYYILSILSLLIFHFILIQCVEDNDSILNYNLTKANILNYLRMIGYCGFSGIMGGQSLLFAKSFVELLKSAFEGSNALLEWQTYIILFMLITCLLLQVNFLNGALKHFDSLFVIPVYQSYWILAGVIGGLVCFGEWEEMSISDSRRFLLGIGITFFGLFILTRKEKQKKYSSLNTYE